MRLYHFTTAVHGLSNLAQKRLKIAMFPDVNDPYELEAVRVTDSSSSQVLSSLRERLRIEVGMLCFSENFTETLMWSHYAQRHTGMVLAFDVIGRAEPGGDEGSPAYKVTYSSERPIISDDVTNDLFAFETLTTKSKSWEYEKEWRKLLFLNTIEGVTQSDDGNLFFYDFATDMKLVEVLLGAKCIIRPFKIFEALDRSGLKASVTSMGIDRTSFEIVRGKRWDRPTRMKDL